MHYIDAHVHVYTDDLDRYPLAPGYEPQQMKPPRFLPEDILSHANRCGVDRIVLVQYELPERSAVVPVPGRTDRMEILIKEPAPPLEITRLDAQQSVELEPGVTYRRYVADNLVDGTVDIGPGREEWRFSGSWLAVALSLVLGVVGLYAVLRKAPTTGAGAAGGTRGPSPSADGD